MSFTDDPLWYKDAVIYQLHVKSFFDANNDGIGDFAGLIQKLDYIAGLGVNTIWLLPFYPSPRRDDGYDIAEYRGVHPDYGTRAGVRRFIAEAHRRGLRVITELVINHTSDQHPWFQRARLAPAGSKARQFYVWSDTDTAFADTRIIFIDSEKSNWTWDPVANAYYWHRFYCHQPDLNFDNPQVLRAVLSVMRYWLDMGVDGLRLDAVPYLVEREGTNNENLPETHQILKTIRAEIDSHYPDRLLLAEANQWPEDTQSYFGNGDECHMAFHFPLMPRMYMAVAQEDRFPITDILRQTPDIPANCQWAIFLRNHDELTLEMVTDKERDYLWQQYAADSRARLNLGIRRRLAPLLQRDRRRVELLNSLLLSMPGTPVIYYGDEIGMGDNIYLGDRDGVRTPMQWSSDRNGGFSRADPAQLVLPPIMDLLYGYSVVNVEAQSGDSFSLLNWMRRMLAIRSRQQAFGRGTLKLLSPNNRRILAYLREYAGPDGAQTILCVANVSRSAQAVELDLAAFAGQVPVEMVGGSAFPPIGQLPYLLTLPPYGFYWFALAPMAQMPSWHVPAPEPMPDYLTLVFRRDVSEILEPPMRALLEREVLPTYLPMRRWYAAKDAPLVSARIAEAVLLPDTTPSILLTEIAAITANGEEHYLLPLEFIAEEDLTAAPPQQLALARVRRGRRVGFLTDASTLDSLAHAVIRLLRDDARLPTADGEVRFIVTSRLAELDIPTDAEVRHLAAEQSNTSLVVGDQAIVKFIRRITGGQHPEAEMGRVLTERGFANIAPLLGEVTRISADGTPHVLAVVQHFMHNQGDAWSWTQNTLERAMRDLNTAVDSNTEARQTAILAEFSQSAAILGQRLGEMHRVLAQASDDPAFSPEPVTEWKCTEWQQSIQAQLQRALEVLANSTAQLDALDQQRAAVLLAHREPLDEVVASLARAGLGSLCTRTHGDLHLGQVLVAHGDAYFIDFEGEPARPLAERRAKSSPLRDVAGILRSFDYATATAANNPSVDGIDQCQQQRHELIERFRVTSEQAFLAAYHQAAAAIPHQWEDPNGAQAMIQLFTLEKAVYEIAYEAAHRPSWLGIPLRGLLAIAHRLGITAATTDNLTADAVELRPLDQNHE
ncbi:MAG: maltose alpha-D-glucosyltransferase [Porticoccaceae bacterium]